MGQGFHANTFSNVNTETLEIPKRRTYMRPKRCMWRAGRTQSCSVRRDTELLTIRIQINCAEII